jgi:hypothetical protein
MKISCVSILCFSLISAAVVGTAATPAQDHKFLSQLYQDLLNRSPNRQEQTLYTHVLGSGGLRTQIAGAITSSSEYLKDQIDQYFGEFLKRPATAGEVTFYLSLVQNGATDDDVKSGIFGSDEYYRLAGGTDLGFLNELFQDVLGRSIDQPTAAAFENLLTKGTPRQTIAAMILQSVEADQREVGEFFSKLLHRAPQPSELSNYTQMLQLKAKDELVIDLICGSDEYFQNAISK